MSPQWTGYEAMLASRTVAVQGMIDGVCAQELIAGLLYLAQVDHHAPVHLHIDSLGGSIIESLAIYDAMDQVPAPVHTHCTGRASGTALLLLAHGAPGHRTAVVGARMELVDVVAPSDAPGAALEHARSILVGHLARATGQPPDRIRRDMVASRRLGLEEAVAYGLLDGTAC